MGGVPALRHSLLAAEARDKKSSSAQAVPGVPLFSRVQTSFSQNRLTGQRSGAKLAHTHALERRHEMKETQVLLDLFEEGYWKKSVARTEFESNRCEG